MAAKKGKRGRRGGGGAMMGMRSGFKSAVGKGKKKKKHKTEASMQQVLFWSFMAAMVLVLIWRISL